jgi:hypothetical protein
VRGCPSELVLARAFTVGAEVPLRLHVESCERCLRRRREVDELRVAMRALPVAKLSQQTHERLRQAVVLGGRIGQAHASLVQPAIWALGAAAVMLLLVALPPSLRPPVANNASHGKVVGVGLARYALVGERPDEMVRLEEGTISVEVKRLGPGERFRVLTGDAEVEVRGTAFEVTARGDRLAGVRVWHGRVEVRPIGREIGVLEAGQSWAPEPTDIHAEWIEVFPQKFDRMKRPPLSHRSTPRPVRATSVPAPLAPEESAPEPLQPVVDPPAVPSAPPPAPAAAAQGPSPQGSPAEEHFGRGWAALRHDPDLALEELDAAERSAGAGPILEDIHYWRAVTLQRSGRRQEAGLAFAEFLQQHPASARAGEASVALGWIWLSMGRREAARSRFEAAAVDPSRRVRQSALAGLAAAGGGALR